MNNTITIDGVEYYLTPVVDINIIKINDYVEIKNRRYPCKVLKILEDNNLLIEGIGQVNINEIVHHLPVNTINNTRS